MDISDHSASMMWDPPVRGARLKADVYVVHIHRLPRGDNPVYNVVQVRNSAYPSYLLDNNLCLHGAYYPIVGARRLSPVLIQESRSGHFPNLFGLGKWAIARRV